MVTQTEKVIQQNGYTKHEVWPHAMSPEIALNITKRDPFPQYILLPNFHYFDYCSFYPDFTGINLFQGKIHSVNYYESATPSVISL